MSIKFSVPQLRNLVLARQGDGIFILVSMALFKLVFRKDVLTDGLVNILILDKKSTSGSLDAKKNDPKLI
ncbi:hypothetical protein BpHYR1_032272 [Brachionus plicatilis]|uniref:Uncharacterized protein n=1 Tax=Brachionus plicatilis TaxID=10195 RepID=A0A3M7SNU5_BRAPC|nr:hypothetical protein BpHYR1_032272 [Brachionus plicatilis]